MTLGRMGLLLTSLVGGGVQTVAPRLHGRIPQAAIAPVDSLVALAEQSGLPTEPLVQKALEGGAKGASPDRIVAAVAAKATELRGAQVLLLRGSAGRAPAGPEVTAVAAALARRLPPELAERIAGALPGEPPGPAMHAVADLVGHRVAEDAAVDLIVTAANAGLRGLRLLDVAAAAVRELQRGRSTTAALATVRAALPGIPLPPPPSRNTLRGARRPVPG